MSRTPPLDFSYDERTDVMTIEGLRFSGHFFRQLHGEIALNRPMTIVERKDGAVLIRLLSKDDLRRHL